MSLVEYASVEFEIKNSCEENHLQLQHSFFFFNEISKNDQVAWNSS